MTTRGIITHKKHLPDSFKAWPHHFLSGKWLSDMLVSHQRGLPVVFGQASSQIGWKSLLKKRLLAAEIAETAEKNNLKA